MATQLTVQVSDELAERLEELADELPQILELGLRRWDAQSHESHDSFDGLADVLEALAALPSPEDVLALRPSPEFQGRVRELLEKNRTEKLTPDEEKEWRRFELAEHLVRIAKARAIEKRNQGGGSDEPNSHSS